MVKMRGVCEGGDTLRSDMANWGVLKAIVTVRLPLCTYFSVCEVIQVLEEQLG
jgi:hypothetical protein